MILTCLLYFFFKPASTPQIKNTESIVEISKKRKLDEIEAGEKSLSKKTPEKTTCITNAEHSSEPNVNIIILFSNNLAFYINLQFFKYL